MRYNITNQTKTLKKERWADEAQVTVAFGYKNRMGLREPQPASFKVVGF